MVHVNDVGAQLAQQVAKGPRRGGGQRLVPMVEVQIRPRDAHDFEAFAQRADLGFALDFCDFCVRTAAQAARNDADFMPPTREQSRERVHRKFDATQLFRRKAVRGEQDLHASEVPARRARTLSSASK